MRINHLVCLMGLMLGAVPSMAGTGTASGAIQKVETDASATSVLCKQDHFFLKIGGNTYYGEYNEAGKGILQLAISAYTAGKLVDLTWNDAATICTPGIKKIEILSFQ